MKTLKEKISFKLNKENMLGSDQGIRPEINNWKQTSTAYLKTAQAEILSYTAQNRIGDVHVCDVLWIHRVSE